MSLYEECGKINIMHGVRKFRANLDGTVPVPVVLKTEDGWLNHKVDQERSCVLWHSVFYSLYGHVHSKCMDCWKSYYKPKTLEELFEIEQFQVKDQKAFLDVASKCGIEQRSFTGNMGGYGAFWYNPLGCGLAQARKNTHTLREATGKEILLKRGCTEMEWTTKSQLGLGSDDWDKLRTKEHEFFEKLLESTFYLEGKSKRTPGVMIPDIHQRWIEFAAEHGDMTYLKYRDQPLLVKTVQYMGSIHNPKDFPRRDYGTDNHGSEQAENDRDARGEESEGVKTLAEM